MRKEGIVFSVFLGCAVIIGYPFFAINYFEILPAYEILWEHCVVPVTMCTITFFTFFYFKKLRKYNPSTKSKVKRIAQDIINPLFGSLACAAVISAIAFSVIITTNTWLGKNEPVTINSPVITYSKGTTRYGRTTHHITFIDASTNDTISLGVYRQYEAREVFTKTLYRGKWGILYSKN